MPAKLNVNIFAARLGVRRPRGVAPDWTEADIEQAANLSVAAINGARAQLRRDYYFLFELLEARPRATRDEPFTSGA